MVIYSEWRYIEFHIDFLPTKNLGAFPGRPGRGKGLVAAALRPAAARQERGACRRSRGAQEAAGTCFGRNFGETRGLVPSGEPTKSNGKWP